MRHKAGLSLALAFLLFAGVAAYAKWPHSPLPKSARADRIVVHKAERKMLLFSGQKLLRAYPMALGFEPQGAKEMEGDGKTPEGLYTIDYRNPKSQFHLSLHISYPTPEQIKRARKQGILPGGMVMIHGLGEGRGFLGRLHQLMDWTTGCIAVTNAEMEEIWRVVPDGTPIEIHP